ncbi:hypothetical protein CEXT_417801 [Caerostris extrusa]|uniref:Uncharacterized protein n=1 Tax=Caerostris extrusa TaxID=172846 RepID=A0AAV4NPG7_CAEEX|nr:hypothetical protein CEXT_417801 [Caerostris extrusa]
MTSIKMGTAYRLYRLKIIFPKSLIRRRTHLTFISQRNIDTYKSQKSIQFPQGVKSEKTTSWNSSRRQKLSPDAFMQKSSWQITPMEHPSKGNSSSTVNTP